MKIKNILKPENWWIIILSSIILWMLFTIFDNPEYNKAFYFILPGLRITFLSTLISFVIAIFLGLISGIGSVLKSFSPSTKIFGASAKNSGALAASMLAGQIIETEHLDTLADGCAGGVDEGSVTLPIASEVIDRVIECSEDQIIDAIRKLAWTENIIVEGAAALAFAAFLAEKSSFEGKTNVVLLCGGNFDKNVLLPIVSR